MTAFRSLIVLQQQPAAVFLGSSNRKEKCPSPGEDATQSLYICFLDGETPQVNLDPCSKQHNETKRFSPNTEGSQQRNNNYFYSFSVLWQKSYPEKS